MQHHRAAIFYSDIKKWNVMKYVLNTIIRIFFLKSIFIVLVNKSTLIQISAYNKIIFQMMAGNYKN